MKIANKWPSPSPHILKTLKGRLQPSPTRRLKQECNPAAVAWMADFNGDGPDPGAGASRRPRRSQALKETTAELWRRTIDVNLTSAFLVTWAVKDGMIERGYGRIVNVASIAALRPRPKSIAYAASKAGMIGLTRSLAEAVAPDGVRVTAVAPGLIKTDSLTDVDQSVLDGLVEATPMKRIGQPEDIAGVVVFLLGDDSNFMTGQTLVASGGRVTLP